MAAKVAVKREGPFDRKMLLRLSEGHMDDIEKASKKAKLSKMGFVRRAIERQIAMQMRGS